MTDRNSVLEEAAKVADESKIGATRPYVKGWDDACEEIAHNIRALRTPVEPVLPGGEAVGTSISPQEQGIREALEEVMSWISHWAPHFTFEDEWTATKEKVRTALSSVGRGGGGK